jgi:hypothetical protein
VLGFVLRAAWAYLHPTDNIGEAANVAIALASGRGFADAYGPGQGPTAHLMPIAPAIASIFYRIFGLHTVASRVALDGWSISVSMASYIFFNRAFYQLGFDQFVRGSALLFLSLVPLYIGQESEVFGVWEGGLAALLISITLAHLTSEGASKSRYFIFSCAVLCAVTFVVNPIDGVACGLAALMGMRGNWNIRSYASFLLSGGVMLAVLLGPWVVRNELVLGTPVLTRSNFGLELALGTNPDMLSSKPHDLAFKKRMQQLHPSVNQAAFLQVKRVGEIEYSRRLGSEAISWIEAHPREEGRLLVLHLRQMIAPQPWLFRMLGDARAAEARSVLETLIGISGLIGLLFNCWARGQWSSVAMMLIVPALLFAPFQITHRYNYVFYAPLVFLAANTMSLIFQSFRRRMPATLCSQGGRRVVQRR